MALRARQLFSTPTLAFWIPSVALTLWAAWFVWVSSFEVDGRRYFILFDDSLITMTYARNLWEGKGLTWAGWGDPVEGYTHPLWLGVMVLLQALPLDMPLRSLPVILVSFGCLVANLAVLYVLMRRHFWWGRSNLAWVAVALTAGYYPLAYWSLRGMETGLQALLVSLGVLLALDIVHGRRRRIVTLFVVMAVALLLRPDTAVLCVVLLGYVVTFDGVRKQEARDWLVGGAILLGFVGGYEVLRLLYFGDPLPNTYYLKLHEIPLEVRLARGINTWADFAAPLAVPFAVVAFVSGMLTVRHRPILLPAALVVAHFGYSVWVGGDRWEGPTIGANRFVAVAMPMFFVLVAVVLQTATDTLRRFGGLAVIGAGGLLTVAATMCVFALGNGLHGDNWRVRLAGLCLEYPPEMVAEDARALNAVLETSRRFDAGNRLAVSYAGVAGVFTDFELVDFLGYNDREIAHGPPGRNLTPQNLWPGHVKYDLEVTAKVREPDLILIWSHGGANDPEERRMLEALGYRRSGRLWVHQRARERDR